VKIVEDAACAAGAAYRDVSAGALGDVACFSFHPRKSITTGEGGMLVTNDAEIAARADVMRNHGASVSEEQRHLGPQPHILPAFDELGFNYRMTDLQAAIGIVQLGKLDRFIAERERWARFYQQQLADIGWMHQPVVPNDRRHAWQSYVIYIDPKTAPLPRDDIMARLHEMGVATRPGTHAVHMLGFYAGRFGYSAADLPVARDCEHNTMEIPVHNRMTEDDLTYVVDCIKNVVRLA
jgi:dTDP-4-amino-4,6-dideoxygalactose transaminase